MLRGIYTAAAGMANAQKRQDATANNIANSSTTGYKQDKIAAEPFEKVLLQNKDKTVFGRPQTQELGYMSFGVEEGEVFTDFTQGPVTETGKDLDMAINGRGFFTLRQFDGIKEELKYTRDGSFSIDRDGRIVTSEGAYVLARETGTDQVVPMEVGDGKVVVDSTGHVYVDSIEKYRILISDFDNFDNIAKEGKNMYRVTTEDVIPREMGQGDYEIKQGMLEQSNTDMSTEMISMITNLRSYQANQRVIQSIDQTLGKAVNEVGALK